MILAVKRLKYFVLISLLFLCFSCVNASKIETFNGKIFGTTYSIKYVNSPQVSKANLQYQIDSLLNAINNSLSTYDKNSLISKFNRGEEYLLDNYFIEVFLNSGYVYRQSKGYFDPTVGTAINVLGFGSEDSKVDLSYFSKDSLKQTIGFSKLNLDTLGGKLYRESPSIKLDFSAIAKGYAVDIISRFLVEKNQIGNHMIEIGGEIIAKGYKSINQPWAIGIQNPIANGNNTVETIFLKNKAIATSGNYRKFKIDKASGKKYNHIINPKTLDPENSSILSASVLADKCDIADAFATSLMIMPLSEGKRMIEMEANTEALWIVEVDGEIKRIFSSGWEVMTQVN